jgi:hypothetical protein
MVMLVPSEMPTKPKDRRQMNALVDRFGGLVKAVISGFDRIVFKGRILPLLCEEKVESFCNSNRILNKDYKAWMVAQSAALVQSVNEYAVRESGHPVTHLSSYRIDKDKAARERQRLSSCSMPNSTRSGRRCSTASLLSFSPP